MGRLNIGRVYLGLGKIWVLCSSGLGKISVIVFQLHGFRVDKMGLEHLFVGYFLLVKIKDSRY